MLSEKPGTKIRGPINFDQLQLRLQFWRGIISHPTRWILTVSIPIYHQDHNIIHILQLIELLKSIVKMGFFDSLSDLVSAATPWSQAEAEAVSGGSSTESTPAQKDDGGEGEAKVCLLLLSAGV